VIGEDTAGLRGGGLETGRGLVEDEVWWLRSVGSAAVWFLWQCGFCGSVGSAAVWFLWKCGFCGSVVSVEVWFLWKCGFCGSVVSVEVWFL
jgi:hypothetical protein